MSKIYPDVGPGEKKDINWRKQDFLFACCDCHSVHRLRFIVAGNMLRLRAWKENKRTAALRRYRGIPVLDKRKEW